MESVAYLALFSGLIIGFALFRKSATHFLSLYYTRNLVHDDYLADSFEAIVTNEFDKVLFMKQLGLRSEAKFRKLVQDAEKSAKSNIVDSRKVLQDVYYKRFFPIAVVIGVLFLQFYLYYVLGLLIVITAVICYDRFVKGYKQGLYERSMLLSVLASAKDK